MKEGLFLKLFNFVFISVIPHPLFKDMLHQRNEKT